MLFVSYREFGSLKGRFTVEGASLDIHACLRYMRDTLQVGNVHLYGHSLGGAIVLEYIRHAQVNRIAKLYSKVVLVNTFTCYADAFGEYIESRTSRDAWVSSIMHELIEKYFMYNSLENIKYVNANDMLIVHSDADELVSKEHAVKLGKKIGVDPAILSGTHNSTIWSPAAWRCILEFLRGKPMHPAFLEETPVHSVSFPKICAD